MMFLGIGLCHNSFCLRNISFFFVLGEVPISSFFFIGILFNER